MKNEGSSSNDVITLSRFHAVPDGYPIHNWHQGIADMILALCGLRVFI